MLVDTKVGLNARPFLAVNIVPNCCNAGISWGDSRQLDALVMKLQITENTSADLIVPKQILINSTFGQQEYSRNLQKPLYKTLPDIVYICTLEYYDLNLPQQILHYYI